MMLFGQGVNLICESANRKPAMISQDDNSPQNNIV